MQKYGNLSGDSGVIAYDTGGDFIDVEFRRATYRYTYASAGESVIEHMRQLAEAGKGLSTYIAQNKPPYASKF